jgi:hypothetical protein
VAGSCEYGDKPSRSGVTDLTTYDAVSTSGIILGPLH